MVRTRIWFGFLFLFVGAIAEAEPRILTYPCRPPENPTPDNQMKLWPNLCLTATAGAYILDFSQQGKRQQNLIHFGQIYGGLNLIPAIYPRQLEMVIQSRRYRWDTVEFLLSAKRDKKAALRFFKKAVRQCGTPRVINIDKSGANKAGIDALNDTCGLDIEIRQVKSLNNIVEQSHRLIRRMTRPMLGLQNFWSAATTISEIEMVHMLYRNQIDVPGQTPSERFVALAV